MSPLIYKYRCTNKMPVNVPQCCHHFRFRIYAHLTPCYIRSSWSRDKHHMSQMMLIEECDQVIIREKEETPNAMLSRGIVRSIALRCCRAVDPKL